MTTDPTVSGVAEKTINSEDPKPAASEGESKCDANDYSRFDEVDDSDDNDGLVEDAKEPEVLTKQEAINLANVMKGM